MTFAVCLQVPNHIRFSRWSDIYTNFIPQMIFLQSIFGYLVVCIIYKWTIDWSKASTQPPSLLNMLIGMVLSPGSVDPDTQLYPGQATVQVILLLMAGVCVPWLLITKPYLQYKEMQKTHGQGYIGLGADEAPRDVEDVTLEGEEEGNGRAIVEANDEEHVSHPVCMVLWCLPLGLCRGGRVVAVYHEWLSGGSCAPSGLLCSPSARCPSILPREATLDVDACCGLRAASTAHRIDVKAEQAVSQGWLRALIYADATALS